MRSNKMEQPADQRPTQLDENNGDDSKVILSPVLPVDGARNSDTSSREQRLGVVNPKAHGRLSVNGEYNFAIPTQEGAREFVQDHHGSESWRLKVLEFLHKRQVQYVLISLLILDVIILFIDLFLLTQYPMCAIIERDCISCCPETTAHAVTDNLRFLSSEADHANEEICEDGLTPTVGTGGCDPEKWPNVHSAEFGFFIITILILSIFFVELNLEMMALHPCVFFRQFFYALDYLIVTVSLVLELSFHFVHEDNLATLLGLLVFGRIWRFVRIGHGIIEATSELTHQKYEKLMKYTLALEAAAKENNLDLPPCPRSVHKALLEEEENISSHHTGSNEEGAKS